MKALSRLWVVLFVVITVFLPNNRSLADDTCIFTREPVPPNIIILFDTPRELQSIIWHKDYDDSIDYTPTGSVDVVTDGNMATGTGFYNEFGYTISQNARKPFNLIPINSDLTPSTTIALPGIDPNDSTPDFTINGRTVMLPAISGASPSTDVPVDLDGDGDNDVKISDGVARFRYSANYLNWIFFYTTPVDKDGDGELEPVYLPTADVLPNMSRMYMVKLAMLKTIYSTKKKAKFALYRFNGGSGATQQAPIAFATDTAGELVDVWAGKINGLPINNESPLAEGLAQVGGKFDGAEIPLDYTCQQNYVILVSPGKSSHDQVGYSNSYVPKNQDFADHDGDAGVVGGEGYIKWGVEGSYTSAKIPVYDDGVADNKGSTYLDDVAHYLYKYDVVSGVGGFQNVITYTIAYMADETNRRFLINTSNNGNGYTNLYDTSNENYEKYHFDANDPDALASALMNAINSILERTNSFTAPVVPVTRTTSGNRIYLSFFAPSSGNFWEGNVVKFGLNAANQIVDKNDNLATNPNGSLKESAVPHWATINWAAPYNALTNPNGVLAANRTIYTFLGDSDLTADSNAFKDKPAITAELGTVTTPYASADIINYIRGADVLDEDKDGNKTENRRFITGDILHSEPLVYEYIFATGAPRTMVYFGANDGMLHAVNDVDGTEAWGFIPPHHLSRLKGIIPGQPRPAEDPPLGHLYFVDATPKIYHDDLNKNKIIDGVEKVYLVSGERKGSKGYFALDVTNPDKPLYLWRINQTLANVIPELAESWSNPVFGRVKTSATDTVGTPVFFIGAGYNSTNSFGKAILVINVLTGAVVKEFKGDVDMKFSIASEVRILDTNSNGFIDKAYVGDMGGQMWRLGKFTASDGVTALPFPASDENINNWTAKRIFSAGNSSAGVPRKFFYPPSVTLERGYDLVHNGTGDRENPCLPNPLIDTFDLVFTVKDGHDSAPLLLTPASPVLNVTNPAAVGYKIPDLDGVVDAGWYYNLATGEKMLAEGTVLNKVFYFTTFTPNNDLCLPGGIAKLYALNYKTGEAVSGFLTDGSPGIKIGGGIPSKPVIVLSGGAENPKLLISVGSTTPDAASDSQEAGIIVKDAAPSARNFFYIWWKELFN